MTQLVPMEEITGGLERWISSTMVSGNSERTVTTRQTTRVDVTTIWGGEGELSAALDDGPLRTSI